MVCAIVQFMYDDLYKSLFDVVNFFIQPGQDRKLLKRAGVTLDAALFPLLMTIARFGSLNITDLAERVGRDHSTISRQINKLVILKLVTVLVSGQDKRIRCLSLTESGKIMTKKIATTRRIMMKEALKDWNEPELITLRSELKRLAETLKR